MAAMRESYDAPPPTPQRRGVYDPAYAATLTAAWARYVSAALRTARPVIIPLDLPAAAAMPHIRGLLAAAVIRCQPERGGRGWCHYALVLEDA